jgi:hypothetical protein
VKRKLIIFLCLLWISVDLFSWWDVPHMLIAQIAKDQLEPEVVQKVEDLLSYFEEDFPESNTFVTASCFPDDITSLGLSGFKVWHGVLTPYCIDSFLTERETSCIEALINDNNLHAAIRQCLKTLKNKNAKKWEKSFLTRCLMHCVADIHQPMHCIQLYSLQFPHGDLAGHRFSISGMPYKNLHLLWDAAFGVGAQKMSRPLSLHDEEWICATANSIEAEFPEQSLSESRDMDYLHWSKESHEVAIHVAYQGIQVGENPSSDYLARGKQAALRQIALAGYRLATLLDETFND